VKALIFSNMSGKNRRKIQRQKKKTAGNLYSRNEEPKCGNDEIHASPVKGGKPNQGVRKSRGHKKIHEGDKPNRGRLRGLGKKNRRLSHKSAAGPSGGARQRIPGPRYTAKEEKMRAQPEHNGSKTTTWNRDHSCSGGGGGYVVLRQKGGKVNWYKMVGVLNTRRLPYISALMSSLVGTRREEASVQGGQPKCPKIPLS